MTMCATKMEWFNTIWLLTATLLATSLAHKEKNILRMLKIEQQLGEDLPIYIGTAEVKLQKLKRAASQLHKFRSDSLDRIRRVVENPTQSFHTLNQLYTVRREVDEFAKDGLDTAFVDNVFHGLSSQVKADDLGEEIRHVFYLQDTYSLTTARMVNGSLYGYPMPCPLDAESCLLLGETACNRKDLYHGILWLQQALRALRQEDRRGGPLEARVLDFLAFALYAKSKEDNLEMALKLSKRLLKIAPDHERARKNVRLYKDMLKSRSSQTSQTSRTKSPSVNNKRSYRVLTYGLHQKNFEKMCQGKFRNFTSKNPQLACRYAHPHPYFMLRPLKEELISKAPDVYVYYDVLTDVEIREIKHVATPMLGPSKVYLQVSKKESTESSRSSLTAWLGNDMDIVSKINNKVSAITGFFTAGIEGEPIQVVKYSPGQEFKPHHDFFPNPDKSLGNRMATALFYLSDVSVSGATIFVKTNSTVFPEKGAMLYWRNLLKSGSGDRRTTHAGCPVLVGTKWICTKWIRENGQEKLSHCDVNPDL